MKKPVIFFVILLYSINGFSQTDTVNKGEPSAFVRITKALSNYVPDTSAVPDDKITRKIQELRRLRGGFNINEAISFKLEEERQKKEMTEAEINALGNFFQNGNGKRWLDNAVTWMYRKQFTYKEIKQLVKFYKTSAGQKLADDLPLIMVQSLAAAEILKNYFQKSNK